MIPSRPPTRWTAPRHASTVMPAPRAAHGSPPFPQRPAEPSSTPAHPRTLQLSVERPETGIVVVRMFGEIDLSSVDRLTELIRQRLTAAVLHALVLDLSRITFANSCGLELLLHAQRRAEHRHIDMYVVTGGGAITRLLALADMTGRFQLRDSDAEAVAELRP